MPHFQDAFLFFDGGMGTMLQAAGLAPGELPERLNPGGAALFEVGYDQAPAVAALLRAAVGEPFTRRDLCGVERVVGAVYTR